MEAARELLSMNTMVLIIRHTEDGSSFLWELSRKGFSIKGSDAFTIHAECLKRNVTRMWSFGMKWYTTAIMIIIR